MNEGLSYERPVQLHLIAWLYRKTVTAYIHGHRATDETLIGQADHEFQLQR